MSAAGATSIKMKIRPETEARRELMNKMNAEHYDCHNEQVIASKLSNYNHSDTLFTPSRR